MRGGAMAMIYQDPQTSLNPVFTIGEQIAEAVRLHRSDGNAAARARAMEMLRLVNIPDPDARRRSLSASIVGRHAAARRHRHGARLRSEIADRR